MNDRVRSGVLMLATAGGLLYLFVTGGLQRQVDLLTGAVKSAPVGNPYPIRTLVAKRATGFATPNRGGLGAK